jgi:hypothetical protein
MICITCRGGPLLPGTPTDMHSWLRQAIALTVRLGCPLQQVIYRHLVNPVNWEEQSHLLRYPGFDVNQAQVRLIWLGQTVNASYPCAVGASHAMCLVNAPALCASMVLLGLSEPRLHCQSGA